MPATSATGGYLIPNTTAPAFSFDGPAGFGFDQGYWNGTIFPLEDDALDNFLQQLVSGIMGMAGANVRPRWQPEMPELPAQGTDWAAVGVVDEAPEPGFTVAYQVMGSTGQYMTTREHELLTVAVSVYGPNAGTNAKRLKRGLSIAQNRAQLMLAGMGLVEVQDIVNAPILLKNIWTKRKDFRFVLKREIVSDYPVEELLSAAFTLTTNNAAGGTVTTVPTPVTITNLNP